MKKNRNLKTILIAAYLTIPMALGAVPLTVSAAGSNTITINSVTGYTNSEIAAYKIFAGAYDSANSNLTVTHTLATTTFMQGAYCMFNIFVVHRFYSKLFVE